MAQSKCRFAHQFTQKELLLSSEARDRYLQRSSINLIEKRFLSAIAYWEGQFPQNGVGLNEATCYTYDGHGIDLDTGLPVDPLHDFSAPSKESLHLMALAHALGGNKYARVF